MNIMTQNLLRTPTALKALLQDTQFKKVAQQITSVSELHFIGTGSSNHASHGAQSFLSAHLEFPVYVHRPTEHFEVQEHGVLIFVSQTGTSFNVLKCLQEFPNHTKFAVSQNADAAIPLACDYTLDLGIGNEDCNAKTVGVSATFLSLVLFGLNLSKKDQQHNFEVLQDQVNEIEQTIQDSLDLAQTIDGKAFDHMFILTSPSLRSVGAEAALKYLEVALQPAVYCDVDEFSHGYTRMINSKSLILYLAQESSSYDDQLNQLVEESKATMCKLQPTSGVMAGLAFVHGIISIIADQMAIDPNQPIYAWFNDAVQTRV